MGLNLAVPIYERIEMDSEKKKLLNQINSAWNLVNSLKFISMHDDDAIPKVSSLNAREIGHLRNINGHLIGIKERYDACKVVIQLDGVNNDLMIDLIRHFIQAITELENEVENLDWTRSRTKEHSGVIENVTNRSFPMAIEKMTPNEWERAPGASTKFVTRLNGNLAPRFAYAAAVKLAARILATIEMPIIVSAKHIVREIVFAPEAQQAGISILNYFSVVLTEKYPDLEIAVSIKQEGQKVTMTITHPDGSEEAISRTFTEYGLVVTGGLKPTDFLADPNQAMALRHKLDLAAVELKYAKEMLAYVKTDNAMRIEHLEGQVRSFQDLFSRGLKMQESMQDGLLKALSISKSDAVQAKVVEILGKLERAIDGRDEGHAKQIIEEIRQDEPDIFSKLSYFVMESSVGGIIGNLGYDWLKGIWPFGR